MMRKSSIGSGILAIFSIAMMACAMGAEDAGPQAQPGEVSAATAALSTSADDCHTGVPGDDAYCSEACPCTIGEADCDGSSQCLTGLQCSFNVGADFGYEAGDDVCTCPDESRLGFSTFCSELCPCSETQGDCDSDAECQAGLTCYNNVGSFYGLDADTDVCATCLPQDAVHTIDFCTPECPCSEGQGDCDVDADCAAGLECFLNVGVDYGLDPDADVCAACPPPSKNGSSSYCSAECPCEHGEGDCDSDSECQAGLTCVSNVGDQFGMGASDDVCIDL